MVIMASEEGEKTKLSLEEAAINRKERLNQLKRKLPPTDKRAENESSLDEKASLPKPKFRSYKPLDEGLQDNISGEGKPVELEEEVRDILETAHEKVVIEDIDIATLAPRKPDWDLKRDVAKRLEKLERRTQKAIAELIWERLKTGEKDDLSVMVNMNDGRTVVDEE